MPYAEPIKHLRKISSIIAPTEKLECLRDVCKKVDENVLEFWEGVAVKTEKLQLSADQYLAILMYIVVKARIKDLESQMFLIEQFTDDFTLNVTREGYMFLTVKQAIEFLKTVDEDKVGEQGYLKDLIEKKRQELASRNNSHPGSGSQHLSVLIGTREGIASNESFNVMSNPNERD